MTSSITKNRIESIDVLRGIAMVVMALDHVRDYFHVTAITEDPLNLGTTTTLLFFTRWITHFCAPIFVFLSGTSIYLQSQRKTKNELSTFLFKRGLWLIFIEFTVVSLAWSFDLHYSILFLQVIWAIGISMVFLSLLIYLPFRIILALGLFIVLGHNLLDIPESAPDFKTNFWWDLLHHGAFAAYAYAEGHSVFLVYPFVPWLGLMMVGYCAGTLFTKDILPEQRRKLLTYFGLSVLALFVVVRFINVYGDPFPWSSQKNSWFTVLSFVNIHKYPPSLMFMCLTIGSALLLLPVLEKIQNGFTNTMKTFGRTAFFYYIIHIYLIHFLSAICFFARGHTFEESAAISQTFPFKFVVPGEGFGLSVVYLVWILVVAALYPLCKWYDRYKTSHPEKWWLSYI
jgi:uncharacterized membrane protein